MQSSDSNTPVERTLLRLGYPSRSDRRDLWTKPRAALGVPNLESDCIEVVYWEGFPRAAVACGIRPEVVLDYVTGPAFSHPPPVALAFDGSGNTKVFKWDENDFQAVANSPSWERTLAELPGHVSTAQATKVIQAVAEGNRKWLQDSRSKRVVGVLPRIFPEETVVLYELLQNAADSGATEAAFRLESETLLFSHDGFPFTENDVEAISFVNSSTKPPDNIGFMGIGFKAAFEISDRPEVHSPPFCFRFNRQQPGGELLPIPTDCTHPSFGSYTTIFRFPLKEQSGALIADELEQFDGRPLLYIGAALRRITTPGGDFCLRLVEDAGEVRVLEVAESMSKSRREYAVFSRELELSPAAWVEFASNRNLELSQCEGRKQRVSVAISLDKGIPDATLAGRLQVYLPTDVSLPLSFDVQGNFLVGASRKELRHASGPWNREHFQILPMLVADVLEWAKAQAPGTRGWASWYDLIPDWRELEELIGLNIAEEEESASEISLCSAFAGELSKRKLIPAIDSQDSLVFVAPEDTTAVDHDLHTVLSVGDLARLSGSSVITPDLSEMAKEKLAEYIKRFGPAEFKASIEGAEWVGHIDAFSEGAASRPGGRRQLAKVLAYLERNWTKYHPRHLGKCTIVLMQDGNLRAADDEQARRVRTLPDVDIPFPPEEIDSHYDVVHQAFRRDLNRPGDMNLDPSITQDAVKALERVAPTLNPVRIATEIILPLFTGERWQEVSDDRLHRYTWFLMRHSRETMDAIKRSNFKVKVRGLSRKYLPPNQAYFGREYSLDGERLDRLCANGEGVYFLSDDYLQQPGGTKEDWIRFFSELGITAQPRIVTSTQQIQESNLDELRKSTGEPLRVRASLRASPFGDIKARHYALDDFTLDPPIRQIIQDLYRVKPPGWKDRLGHFAAILEAGWSEYKNTLRKELKYVTLFSSYVQRNHVTAQSTLAEFLKDNPWLPVVDDNDTSLRPCEVVLNTEENRKLAHKETPLSYSTFREPSLISFLEIREHPPEVTPLMQLQYAVDHQDGDPNIFEDLYAELARNPSLDANSLRSEFRDQALIFVPDHDPKYITSGEAVFSSRSSLAPRMVAIKDVYPNLEDFFAGSLGVPTSESFEHFAAFLRDYVWKDRPAISDNLRSSVESCYRRFFNHLNQTEDEAREEALSLLKEQLGTPTMVFCGRLGWVDTTKTMVLYPDTAAFEELLSDQPGIAIESHLKRLAQPLNEIRLLLEALNVTPMSEAVRRLPELSEANPHPRSAEFGERLSLLVRKAVAIVEREQAKTESASRNVNLFLQEWRERSEALFGDVRFFESPPINVRDVLAADDTMLQEMQWGAYVSAGTDHLSIYMSGDLIEVFDAIADQLRGVLRIDFLQAGLRDEISSLVQSNLARLGHEQFGVSLNQRLKEKGYPVEEDEELQRIVRSATQHIEAGVQASSEEHVQGPESSTENHSNSNSADTGGDNSGSKEEQSKPPPKAPTSEEILAELPEFDEASFGGDSVVNLLGTSQWQMQTQQHKVGSRSGGGPGGAGNFKSAQAYRVAYGIRGEHLVVAQERRALRDAGRSDLAEQVLHRSQTHEGSPWDIESFEKSHPYRAIYVEVKSTPYADNFEVDMSVDQISAALWSARPYYLYRVLDVHTSKPTVYIYDFKKITPQIQFSATNVSVMLPTPEIPDQ